MNSFLVVYAIILVWLCIGAALACCIYDEPKNHKIEIASAVGIFWPLLIVGCVVFLIFSILIDAFKGLYYILLEFIKRRKTK